MKKPDHKTESRQRTMRYSACAQRGCRFYGKQAIQGVCFHRNEEVSSWEKVERCERELMADIRRARRKMSAAKYVQYLEAAYVTSALNHGFTLDELVRLRRKAALRRARK